MLYHRRSAAVLIPTVVTLLALAVRSGAQLSVGTASGGLVTDGFGVDSSGTQVVIGPSQMFLSADSGNTLAVSQTEFGTNHVKAFSFEGSRAYAASYWGDQLNFTGGLGSFHIGFSYAIDGTFQDSDGYFFIDNSPNGLIINELGDAGDGSTSVRWRTYLFGNLDLSSLQLEGTSPDGGDDMFGPASDPYYNDPYSLKPSNVWSTGYTFGIGFDWQYGRMLNIGSLLEAWSSGGAWADYSNSSKLVAITVTPGTIVTSASGTQYNVVFDPAAVPEPSAVVSGIAMGVIFTTGLVRRRRK